MIGKMALPSVSLHYSVADTFLDDQIDAIRQRTCLSLATVFQRRVVRFQVHRSYTESGFKNQFF